MNSIFGSTLPNDREKLIARIDEFVNTTHKIQAKFIGEAQSNVMVGYSRSGAMVGIASREQCVLLLCGFFGRPLPDFGTGSPLDEPDATASWLLERYLQLGEKFLDELPGHYGIIVIDSCTNTVRLAADPYGQRTLYVHTNNNQLVFSSNIATLAQIVDRRLKLDRSWEDFFLIYGFFPGGRTVFQNTRSLAPGEMLSWCDGSIEVTKIPPIKPNGPTTSSAKPTKELVIESLYQGFMQALEDQASGSNEAGVLLGGFDSALVAAGLHRLGKTVSTWSFHYEDAQYNQPHTEELAETLGIDHHWVHIKEDTIRDGINRFAYLFNQPTNWPNYVIQTAFVCEKMRDAGVEFAYSGDGCDTVFLGYPGTWRRAKLIQHLPSLPAWLTASLAEIFGRPFLERRIGHPWRVLLNLIRTSSWSTEARGFLSFRILDEVSLRQLRADAPPVQEQDLQSVSEMLAGPHSGLPPLRLAYLGKSLVSPNRNKMAGSSDVTGIPIQSPYLHPGFKALAQSLPEELLRPDASTESKVTGKYMLMKMAEEKELLPKSIIYQRKMAAVDAPIDAWYAGPMRNFMLDIMAGLPFDPNRAYLESLLEKHLAEQLFQKYLLTDKVIKHAPSLLSTYAAFCKLADSDTQA